MGWTKGRLDRNLLVEVVVVVVSSAWEASEDEEEEVDSLSTPVSVMRVHFEVVRIG